MKFIIDYLILTRWSRSDPVCNDGKRTICLSTDRATWGLNLDLLAPAVSLWRFACLCMYAINSCFSHTMLAVADEWITAYKDINQHIVHSKSESVVPEEFTQTSK